MSDERKGWLLKHVDYVFNECRVCAEHHNITCSECPRGDEACDQARMELKRLIQQKPEINDMEEYIEEKVRELTVMGFVSADEIDSEIFEAITTEEAIKFITQIIKDARGGGK